MCSSAESPVSRRGSKTSRRQKQILSRPLIPHSWVAGGEVTHWTRCQFIAGTHSEATVRPANVCELEPTTHAGKPQTAQTGTLNLCSDKADHRANICICSRRFYHGGKCTSGMIVYAICTLLFSHRTGQTQVPQSIKTVERHRVVLEGGSWLFFRLPNLPMHPFHKGNEKEKAWAEIAGVRRAVGESLWQLSLKANNCSGAERSQSKPIFTSGSRPSAAAPTLKLRGALAVFPGAAA